MNVMILAAGFGTRLLPHTRRIPKPLFPILDKSLLEIAIDTAKKADPDRVVVNVHHLADQIMEFIESRDFGVDVAVSHEKEIMGTAGCFAAARRLLGGDDLAVINSDVIVEVDWPGLLRFHRRPRALATLMLQNNPDPVRYGALCANSEGRIVRFVNATSKDHTGAEKVMMFTGVSILSPVLLDRIPEGRAVEISSEIYTPMVKRGEALYGYVSGGKWEDAGDADSYHQLVMDRIGGATHPYLSPTNATVHPPVYIHPEAIIGDRASIGPHAAVSDGARVGEGAVINNCVVLPGSVVDDGAVIEGGIV